MNQLPISVNERIVWLSDEYGPQFGVVRWLGKLAEDNNNVMAGVQFDKPIGTGTGFYKDRKLFETPQGHASLVPIIGLMKESDFTSLDNEPPHPERPPRKMKSKHETFKSYIDSPPKEIHSDRNNGRESHAKLSPSYSLESRDDFRSNNNYTRKTSRERNFPKEKRSPDVYSKNYRRLSPESSLDEQSIIEINNRHHSAPVSKDDKNDLFELGEMVIFEYCDSHYHGVVRFFGFVEKDTDIMVDTVEKFSQICVNHQILTAVRKSSTIAPKVMVGIELDEDEHKDLIFNGVRFVGYPPDRLIFVPLLQCHRDDRYLTPSIESISVENSSDSKFFGGIECPVVLGHVDSITTREGFQKLLGLNRGIQGHNNSCYLDALLFSMFASATVFDSLLNRPQSPKDIPEYSEVQKILKEEIVNPLRKNYYVRADKVMKLRRFLESISSMRGLTTEEKDPEEFLDMLLGEVLKTEPFLKFSTGLNSFCYQLFVEKDDSIALPTVQQLFEQSFFNSNLKLKEIPPCLILQMPRFGRQFKTYPRIMPTLYLDITNVLDNSPRQCVICGELADYECRDCYGEHTDGLESVAHCTGCLNRTHRPGSNREKHSYSVLNVPESFRTLKNRLPSVPRVMMELFAVLCIETSHYISFVKCGSDQNAPWCFFDSMADRKGCENGYNIPKVSEFSDMDWFFSPSGSEFLIQNTDDKVLEEFPRRLFCDSYICFYSSEVQRYR